MESRRLVRIRGVAKEWSECKRRRSVERNPDQTLVQKAPSFSGHVISN
jgi:hypothetical protein